MIAPELTRCDQLNSMSVSELKTILSNYMSAKDFITFCEKSQFVKSIIKFEENITLRKKKWQQFRNKYPSIVNSTRDLICINSPKYASIHSLAEQEKTLGNIELKNGNLELAIKHYTLSIRYQIDYKPAYTNRSLVYLKLKKYDKCICDCTFIIEMIRIVDNIGDGAEYLFKSYLRRGQSYKLTCKYFLARSDFELALAIRKNDSTVNKLLTETLVLCNKIELRAKLRAVGSVNDFTSVLSLSMELLQHATINNSHIREEDILIKWKESDELLRRLFVFLYKNKKCCMLFASAKGHILCLKYLQQKMGHNRRYKFTTENMGLLGKLYSLLNRSMPYISVSAIVEIEFEVCEIIYLTFKFFASMVEMRELQTTAMRFVSLIIGNESGGIRSRIIEKYGCEIVSFLSQFKFAAGTEPAKGLFESLSFLLRSSKFLLLLLKNSRKYIYETFLDWFCVYNETLNKRQFYKLGCDTQKPLQFAISVLLDALTLIFDGAIKNPFITLSETEKYEMKISMTKMIASFLSNCTKNDKYILNLKDYFQSTHKMFILSIKSNIVMNENESVAYLSQTAKCMNVFTALSNDSKSINLLFKHTIYAQFISLIEICDASKKLIYFSTNLQMQNMLKLIKNNLMDVFDHISDDKRCDRLFLQKYWKYIMKIFIEPMPTMKTNNKKVIQQAGHNKSCAVRCVYRWLHRSRSNSNPCTKTNKILEIIIYKYFQNIMNCLLINDEQVLANVPLVLSECVKYILYIQQNTMKNPITIEKIKLIQFVKKALTKDRIILMIKLMKTKHTAIQYNAMLLVAQISEIDQELHRVCSSLGALKLLAKYDEARKAKNVEKLLEEPLSFD